MSFTSCRRLIVPRTYEVTVDAKSKRNVTWESRATHRYVVSANGPRGLAVHVVYCEGAPIARRSRVLDREQLETIWRDLEAREVWGLDDDYSGSGDFRWRVSVHEGGDRHSFDLTGESRSPQWEVVRLVQEVLELETPHAGKCERPADGSK